MGQDTGQDREHAVLERLDELIELLRRVDTRLEHLERRPAPPGPLAGGPEVGPPRRVTTAHSRLGDDVEHTILDAARRDLVGRGGPT